MSGNPRFRYVPVRRPPMTLGDMPDTVRWAWLEAPAVPGVIDLPGLPVSRHRFGVICTEQPLTAMQMHRFGLVTPSTANNPI